MSLWVDRNDAVGSDSGRTHALIIGVSHYKWLPKPGNPAPLGRETLNLTQIDVAATSAFLFAKWLDDHFHNPTAELATIRLCLSPSDEELEAIPGLNDVKNTVSGATREEVWKDLQAWQADCKNNPEGIA